MGPWRVPCVHKRFLCVCCILHFSHADSNHALQIGHRILFIYARLMHQKSDQFGYLFYWQTHGQRAGGLNQQIGILANKSHIGENYESRPENKIKKGKLAYEEYTMRAIQAISENTANTGNLMLKDNALIYKLCISCKICLK